MQQSVLQGFQILQRKERELTHMSPTLKLLLRYNAKWDGTMLEHQMTPYHVICESTGDHCQLLNAMLQSAGQALLNAKDSRQCTAMMSAVQNANLNCVRSLITHGADMNLGVEPFQYPIDHDTPSCPLVDSIFRLSRTSSHSTGVMKDIFDLLLKSGVDITITCNSGRIIGQTPAMYAAALDNLYCVKKLLKKRFLVKKVEYIRYLHIAAMSGGIDVMKYLKDKGTDMNTTSRDGLSAFYRAVHKNNIKAVHYLLQLGVLMTNHSMTRYEKLREDEKACNCCTAYRIHLEYMQNLSDPCALVIRQDQVNVVRLMEEHGCQEYQSLYAVRYALMNDRFKVADYLLGNHKHLLNQYYTFGDLLERCPFRTLLTDACREWSVKAILLLLKHGADPNKKSCVAKSPTAMHIAIRAGHSKILSYFIRTGVNINTRSYDPEHDSLLPFEASVLYSNLLAVQILLVSGCSCGVFSLNIWHNIKDDINPEIRKLMMDWEVQKNNAIPLQKLCRMSILNHLCPGAEKKIAELPLPPFLITYLGIPELDDVKKRKDEIIKMGNRT